MQTTKAMQRPQLVQMLSSRLTMSDSLRVCCQIGQQQLLVPMLGLCHKPCPQAVCQVSVLCCTVDSPFCLCMAMLEAYQAYQASIPLEKLRHNAEAVLLQGLGRLHARMVVFVILCSASAPSLHECSRWLYGEGTWQHLVIMYQH